jgi:hypothetical protein
MPGLCQRYERILVAWRGARGPSRSQTREEIAAACRGETRRIPFKAVRGSRVSQRVGRGVFVTGNALRERGRLSPTLVQNRLGRSPVRWVRPWALIGNEGASGCSDHIVWEVWAAVVWHREITSFGLLTSKQHGLGLDVWRCELPRIPLPDGFAGVLARLPNNLPRSCLPGMFSTIVALAEGILGCRRAGGAIRQTSF